MYPIPLEQFADRLLEVMPAMLREFTRRQTDEISKGNITLPQFIILDFLSRQGESNMTNLAQVMNVTTAAMTGIVDRLVKSHYAVREYDQNDRRIIKIKLTLKGAELVSKIKEQRRHMIIQIFDKISDADREEYLRILTQIKDIVSREKAEIT